MNYMTDARPSSAMVVEYPPVIVSKASSQVRTDAVRR